jgi:hypothetical protein
MNNDAPAAIECESGRFFPAGFCKQEKFIQYVPAQMMFDHRFFIDGYS